MARPFTASDDDILNAAGKVINRRGPDGFSMAEVATELGLSRAAIILRFKSTHALKVASLKRMVEQFERLAEAQLPTLPGGDSLLRIAAFICSYTHGRESSKRFFANYYASSVTDRELLKLEQRRGDVLGAAIVRVMPATALDASSAMLAFRAHITGSVTAWLSLEDADPKQYLVMRTTEWLKLAHITFSEEVVQELTAVTPVAATRKRKRSKILKAPQAKVAAVR